MATIVEEQSRATVPASVVVAGVLLGVQGVLSALTGAAVLSTPVRFLGPVSPAAATVVGLLALAGGVFALVTAVALARLRPWARVAAISLAAVAIASNLTLAGVTPWRAVVAFAVPIAVIALLVGEHADEAFDTSGRST